MKEWNFGKTKKDIMTINEIINQSIFKLPLDRTNEDFPTFVELYLNNYFELLGKIEGDYSESIIKRLDIIRKLNNNLTESAKNYYTGHISDAYKYFEEGLNLIKSFLDIDNPIITVVYVDESKNQIRNESYFKARVSFGKPLSKEEMFIRPFQQREEIHTYRYSIPGLPCLYLSNNIYSTWNELNCPDINSIQVSRYELVNIKKLHFGKDISYYKYIIENKQDTKSIEFINEMQNYLTYFPLHALCNIKVHNNKGVFKPEYIFPQFLMQWISKQRIDCIEYMSTQIDYSQFDSKMPHLFFNLAIPAQSTNHKGQCEILKSKLKLSESISWQNLISSFPTLELPLPINENPPTYFSIIKSLWEIELIKGKKVNYNNSLFGIMEKYLIEHMEVDFI